MIVKQKPAVILPLASALGALAGTATLPADAKPAFAGTDIGVNSEATMQKVQKPNTLVSTGETLLGFVTSEQAPAISERTELI
jgi:hypothetical protein